MKTKNMCNIYFFKHNLINIIIFLLTVLLSCKNFEHQGNVKITFANHPSSMNIEIFSAENSNVAIFSGLEPDTNGILEKDLNIGNYFLTFHPFAYRGGIAVFDIGFQVKSGQTTEINFDKNNLGHIK